MQFLSRLLDGVARRTICSKCRKIFILLIDGVATHIWVGCTSITFSLDGAANHIQVGQHAAQCGTLLFELSILHCTAVLSKMRKILRLRDFCILFLRTYFDLIIGNTLIDGVTNHIKISYCPQMALLTILRSVH